jgi:hypothetical protein
MTSFFSKYLLGIALFLVPLLMGAQYTIQGKVFEKNTLTPIADVLVFDSLEFKNTLTNSQGKFSIDSSPLPATLYFQHIGYKPLSIQLHNNQSIEVFLEANELEEVIITGISSFQDTRSGQISINKSVVRALPSLGGEVDYISSLVLFPGVSNGEEISKGITVRGGSLDQNLAHINGIQTSNTGHLFNLYSVVPAVAVEDLTFYKGGMPASFGNALSSSMNVQLKKPKHQIFDAEIGATNSKASYENTFGKNKKSSFLLSGRSSYIDLLRKKANRNTLNDFQLNGETSGGPEYHFGYTFFDVLGLLNIDLGKGLELSGFGLYSYDRNTYIYNRSYITFLKHELYNGTYGFSLSKKWKTNNYLSLRAGVNNNEIKRFERTVEFENSDLQTNDVILNHKYGVKNWTGRLDYYHPVSSHQFSAGLFTYYKQFQPGEGQLANYSYDPILRTRDTMVFDNKNEPFDIPLAGTYLQADLKLSDRLDLNTGIRASAFFTYPETYYGIEPRMALSYKINRTSYIRASFDYLTQFDHGLILSEVGLDNIIALPSVGDIKPAKSLNYALGFVTKQLDHRLIISGELFYKDQWNLQRLALDGKDNIVSDSLSELIAKNGTGYAYGLEFQLTYQADIFVLNSSYTYSHAFRKFEGFNKNKAFPFGYDKPHELSISGVMGLGKKSSFSLNFTLYNGARYTLPSGLNASPSDGGQSVLIYDNFQNDTQLPLYHRLDLGYDYSFKLRKKWKGVLKVNVINIYNRRNINFVELRENSDGTYYQEGVSYIPILPSLNLRFTYE